MIVCEDKKSSKLYFESFKKDEKLKRDLTSVSIEVVHPKDHSPLGLVVEAKAKKLKARRERNPYDEIWIVLDKDYHSNIDKAFDMAYSNRFKIAFSVICFEFWVLLHFERTSKIFIKCEDVINHIKTNHLADYLKCESVYSMIKDRVNTAISNALWIVKYNQNDISRGVKLYNLGAYTDVHVLVERLIDPKKFLDRI